MGGDQRAHDFEHLLIGDRERAGARLRLDIDAKLRGKLAEMPLHPTAQDHRPAAERPSEKDIGHRRHLGHDRQFLVNRRDAGALLGARVMRHHGAPENLGIADVGAIGASENFYQRRLAGSVLTDQTVHFAEAKLEIYIFKRVHAGERFRQATDGDGVPLAPPPPRYPPKNSRTGSALLVSRRSNRKSDAGRPASARSINNSARTGRRSPW